MNDQRKDIAFSLFELESSANDLQLRSWLQGGLWKKSVFALF